MQIYSKMTITDYGANLHQIAVIRSSTNRLIYLAN